MTQRWIKFSTKSWLWTLRKRWANVKFQNQKVNFKVDVKLDFCSSFKPQTWVSNFKLEFEISKLSLKFQTWVSKIKVEFEISNLSLKSQTWVWNFKVEFEISKLSLKFQTWVSKIKLEILWVFGPQLKHKFFFLWI